MKAPQRGEVWLVDLGLAAKVRPALVISVPADDQDQALVSFVPHTTSPRGSRFEANVSVPFLRSGVFDAQNLVTIPHARRHSPIILSYPRAVLFSLDGDAIEEIDVRETKHFLITRDFLNSPERFFKHLFETSDETGTDG